MTLKRLILLVLAIALVGAPIAEASASASGTASPAAKKKGKKKCKKKAKGKKKGKKAKCKKRGGGGGPDGSTGLPGKPVNPEPTEQNNPPDDPDPATLANVALNENPLLAGTSGQGQVTLNEPAPAAGQPVTLGSEDAGRASVPDAVHVAAGQTTATFPVTTTAGPAVSLTITAAIGTSVRTTELDIVEEADLESLELDYQCFPDIGQTFAENVVRLNVRAPTNTVVDLQSSDPLALDVPDNAVVPEGSFTGGFQVETLLTTPSVMVTASYDGVDRTDTAMIRDSGSPAPVPTAMTLTPLSVVVGDPSTGRITLDCEAPSGGLNITLSDDHPLVTTPGSVTIPAGALSATFPIATNATGNAGQAIITGTPPTGTPVQATLELRDIGT